MTWYSTRGSKLPKPWETVLLIHWEDGRPESDPLCESGYMNDSGEFCWHNSIHMHDGLEPHAWGPLPSLPDGMPE